MKSLYNSYDFSIENSYIIYLPNNEISFTLAQRCLASCQNQHHSAQLYEGFDGTSTELKVPYHLQNQSWYKWLKITDHYQTLGEVACSLSHISLWVKCMELDRPIVVFEHDAILVKPYKIHQIYNGIVYLGGKEELTNPRDKSILLPWFSSINKNWNFINRAHAYSIDPAAARKLFSCVLSRGIYESADVMLRADDVAIIQTDFYAYEDPGPTTIVTRKK
jgi:hypothetical protein